MSTTSASAALFEQQLHDRYKLYRKSLRILTRDGVTQAEASGTVCWTQLEALHYCNPRLHRHPEELFAAFRRELTAHGSGSC